MSEDFEIDKDFKDWVLSENMNDYADHESEYSDVFSREGMIRFAYKSWLKSREKFLEEEIAKTQSSQQKR